MVKQIEIEVDDEDEDSEEEDGEEDSGEENREQLRPVDHSAANSSKMNKDSRHFNDIEAIVEEEKDEKLISNNFNSTLRKFDLL